MLLRHAARLVQHGQAAGAVKVLARIDRAFALDSEHIAYRGHRIWQRSEPTAHLEQWWHDFHAQR